MGNQNILVLHALCSSSVRATTDLQRRRAILGTVVNQMDFFFCFP